MRKFFNIKMKKIHSRVTEAIEIGILTKTEYLDNYHNKYFDKYNNDSFVSYIDAVIIGEVDCFITSNESLIKDREKLFERFRLKIKTIKEMLEMQNAK